MFILENAYICDGLFVYHIILYVHLMLESTSLDKILKKDTDKLLILFVQSTAVHHGAMIIRFILTS